METTYYYQSPAGCLELTANEQTLKALRLVNDSRCPRPIPCGNYEPDPQSSANPVIVKTCQQLDEYFAGKRKTFELPLAPEGTAFQQKVWSELQQIPYGETISYAQLAQSVGNPKACRAVGSANGKNPVAIIIPCHRVINTGGGLGGYAYGLDMKKQLLDLERKC